MVTAGPVAIALTSPAVSTQADLDLFVEQLAWIGNHLRDPSRMGVMSWVGRALKVEARSAVQAFFKANHPVQICMEQALVTLLHRPWQKRAARYVCLDLPERNVDWARTYLEELTLPPSRFWAHEQAALLDADMLGALAGLGRTLLEVAELGEPQEVRWPHREVLRRAIERVDQAVGARRVPFTAVHEQRLSRLDDEARRAAKAIRAGLLFWRDAFGADGDALRLRQLGARLNESDLRFGRRTLDSLLELCTAISIARAAVETPDNVDLPEGTPWVIEDVDARDKRNVPYIRLRSGALSCSISKNAPPGDATVSMLAQMGLAPRGHQPDIVLTFSIVGPDGRELSLFVLVDAKRNAEGTGAEYLSTSAEAALIYAMSFGHLMGLRFYPDGGPDIGGDVLPAVTLFCRQGVRKVGGAGPDASTIIARLRDRAPLPVVLALEMAHFFGGQEEQRFSAMILSTWFGRIARQALMTLRARALLPGERTAR